MKRHCLFFAIGALCIALLFAQGIAVSVASPSLYYGQITTDYCDNIIYKDGAVDRILTDEGYITLSASGIPTYHYFLRDHLGSVNVVLDSNRTVEETTHYYPYGTTFPQTSVQPYKFCGKELDRVHGLDWYDSQARMYDPVLARWHTQDSKAEDYYNWSPYAYCMGNPVNAIDPDGNSVWTKLAKASVKIGKQVAKHGAKALTEGATYAQAVADITDDISTLTDSEASAGSKVWAGISLASELLPISINDVKDVGKVAKRVKTTKEEQKASRFIVDLNNNVVDLHKTPIGSYKQPNGDRTDILQNKPHFNKKRKRNDGYSHTHPLELHEEFSGNNHPKYSQDTHQPTFDEIMNIINGRAIPLY